MNLNDSDKNFSPTYVYHLIWRKKSDKIKFITYLWLLDFAILCTSVTTRISYVRIHYLPQWYGRHRVPSVGQPCCRPSTWRSRSPSPSWACRLASTANWWPPQQRPFCSEPEERRSFRPCYWRTIWNYRARGMPLPRIPHGRSHGVLLRKHAFDPADKSACLWTEHHISQSQVVKEIYNISLLDKYLQSQLLCLLTHLLLCLSTSFGPTGHHQVITNKHSVHITKKTSSPNGSVVFSLLQ
jgi:hypothetical protein